VGEETQAMNADQATELARGALMMVIVLSLPVLGAGLVVTLVISVLQAVTQVQDATLSLVPRIIVMLLVAAIVAPWVLSKLVEFGTEMFSALP
jgi:flagellar biosynthetic protein FliQ